MIKARFTLTKAKPPAGILKAEPTREVLRNRATAIAAAAGPGMGVAVERGKNRSRAAAITWSMRARNRERKRHTLARALKVGRSL
jgi:hypothetical protein